MEPSGQSQARAEQSLDPGHPMGTNPFLFQAGGMLTVLVTANTY